MLPPKARGEKSEKDYNKPVLYLVGPMILITIILSLSLFAPSVSAFGDHIPHVGEDEYHNDPMTFLLFTFLMSFATTAILVSLFTFKFGQKRSKIVAIPVLISGLTLWGFWIFYNLVLRADYPDDTLLGVVHWTAAPVLLPIMALIGAAVGFGLAVFIFLTVIVRS